MIKLTDELTQREIAGICEAVLNETLKLDYKYLTTVRVAYEDRLGEIREEHADDDRDDYIEEIEEVKEEYPISGVYIKWNDIEDKTMKEKKELLEVLKEYDLRTSEEIKMEFLKGFEQMIFKKQLTHSESITKIANSYIDEFLN